MLPYMTKLLERMCDKLEIDYSDLKADALVAAAKAEERFRKERTGLEAKWEAIDKEHEQNRKDRAERFAELQKELTKPLPSSLLIRRKSEPEPLTPDQRTQVELQFYKASKYADELLNRLSDYQLHDNSNPLAEKKLRDQWNAASDWVHELEVQLDARK